MKNLLLVIILKRSISDFGRVIFQEDSAFVGVKGLPHFGKGCKFY